MSASMIARLTRPLRWASVAAALLSTLPACTTSDEEELGGSELGVVGTDGKAPAASGEKMAGLIGPAVAKPEAFEPFCTGSIAKWTDTRNGNKPMVTAVTAAHCVGADDANLMGVFPNWKVGGKPAAIALPGWKRSSNGGGALAGVGDVAAATFCPNLTKQAEPWSLPATPVDVGTGVTIHGGREVSNVEHPLELKDAADGVYSKADKFGANDFKSVFQAAEPATVATLRAVALKYWITRPGDSGAGGKSGANLVYVNSGSRPRGGGRYQSIGTRVTEPYMVDLWNGTIAALEGDFDMNGYHSEPSSRPGPDYRPIDCSSTGTLVIADDTLPPLTGSPAVRTDVRAVGTAGDIGAFWHPDYPSVMVDTAAPGLPKIEGGGAPPHSNITWTFTPVPPPPQQPCNPGSGVACVDEGLPPSPPSTDYWARVIRWAPDGTKQIICSACNPGTCVEPSVPHDHPRYFYSIELAGCPAAPPAGGGGGTPPGGGSGSGGGGTLPGGGGGISP